MNSPSREELLSAYLDDELSAGERAQVETWLSEDASYRQLLEELRSVRARIQSLPRHKLDHDLADIVLRRAQRAVLAGEMPSESQAATDSVLGQWWSRRSWRTLAWPAAAAAAALAIALLDRTEQPAERQVARQSPREVGELVSAREKPGQEAQSPAAFSRDEPAGAAVESAKPRAADEVARSRGAAAAPPAGAVAGRMSKQAAAAALANHESASAADLVVCDVAQQFIEDQGFEKLLAEKQIAWERSQDKPRSLAVEVRRKQDELERSGQRYLVQATPDELATILNDLRARRELVKKVEPRQADAEEPKIGSDGPSLKKGEAFRSTPAGRRAIEFWLRPVAQDSPGEEPR